MIINVLDLPDTATAIATALARAKDGDRIYIPSVHTWQAPAGGWLITKNLEIFGDGPGDSDSWDGSALVPNSPNDDVFVIQPPSGVNLQSVYLHDFKIRERAGVIPDGHIGIRCALVNQRLHSLRLERLRILNMADHGVLLDGVNDTTACFGMIAISACTIGSCSAVGALVDHALRVRFTRSTFTSNQGGGLKCTASGAALYNVVGEANGSGTGALVGQFLLSNCTIANVAACHFERFGARPVPYAVQLAGCGGAAVVAGSYFGIESGVTPQCTGVYVPAGNHAVAVLPNRMTRVRPNLVDIVSGDSGCTIFPQFDDVGGLIPPTVGEVALPGAPNNGLIGAPLVRRPQGSDTLAGLIIPSGPADPATTLQNGMLYYDTTNSRLRALVNGAWKTVSTTP